MYKSRRNLFDPLMSIFLLMMSWAFIYIFIAFAVESSLVPWDTTPDRPNPGTISRTINDFFESRPWSHLPGLFVVVLSTIIFCYQIIAKRQSLIHISIEFIISACALLIVSIVGMISISQIGRALGVVSDTLGFQRTWPGILSNIIGIVVMLYIQTMLPILKVTVLKTKGQEL